MRPFLAALICFISTFYHVLAAEYVVFPKNETDVVACARTTQFLNELLFPPNVRACVTEIRKVTHLWLIEAEKAEVEHILQQLEVEIETVLPNTIITKNDGETFPLPFPTGQLNDSPLSNLTTPITRQLIVQKDAPQDLALISWPPRVKLPKAKPKYRLNGYYYNVMAGRDQYVYVIENGVNVDLLDFRKMPYKPVEWLFAPGVRMTYDDNDPYHHGSCVASKVTGFFNGVSKNSHLVTVKATHNIADTAWAFSLIYDDIVKRGRQRDSVILFARSSQLTYYDNDSDLPVYWKTTRVLMHELFKLGVHIVTSSGNGGGAIDTVPAIWHKILPFIVAGAVTVRGEIPRFSQGTWLDDGLVHAPGVDVQCAGGPYQGKVQGINGTSAAAGMVAGLVAYFMGKEPDRRRTPLEMRQYVSVDMSQFRAGSHEPSPEIVWNGEKRMDGADARR